MNKSEFGNSTAFTSRVTFDPSRVTFDPSKVVVDGKIVVNASNGDTQLQPITKVLSATDIQRGYVDVDFTPVEGQKQTVSATYVNATGQSATDKPVTDYAILDTHIASGGQIMGLLPPNQYPAADGVMKISVKLTAGAAVDDIITIKMYSTEFSSGKTLLEYTTTLHVTSADLNAGSIDFDVPGTEFSITKKPTFTAQTSDLAGNVGGYGYSVDAAPMLIKATVADDGYLSASQNSSIQPDAIRVELGEKKPSSLNPGTVQVAAYNYYDNATTDSSLEFSISSAPSTTLDVYDYGVKVGSIVANASVDSSGLSTTKWTKDLSNGFHELTIKSVSNGQESMASEKFTVLIQDRLDLDLSKIAPESNGDFLVSGSNDKAERYELKLEDLLTKLEVKNGVAAHVLTFKGDATDTLLIADPKFAPYDSHFSFAGQVDDYAKHENGYWKFDLTGDGVADLLVQDSIHRIVL